jgi:ankyrin repeat protein
VADPILGAKRAASLEAFLTDYDPEVTPRYSSPSTGQTALFGALANRDPQTRVAIANRLLDDGADASVVTTTGTTLLHVLLGQRAHDPAGEAALASRLLDGGADVNAADAKYGAPLAMLYNTSISDEEAVPLYEVFLARADLDLDARATSARTVREWIMDAAPRNRPILQQMVRDREASGGAAR